MFLNLLRFGSVFSLVSSIVALLFAVFVFLVIHGLLAPSKNSACRNKNKHNFELKSFDKQFSCDGCKQQGFGQRCVCRDCKCEFHVVCDPAKDTVSLEYFGMTRDFRFSKEPQVQVHKRYCDACGKDILGFNYRSSDGKWNLHPCCSKLQKKLVIEETLFELHKKISSKCNWCREKKISGSSVPGWGYASRCGDYNFHVYCLMEMLHTNASGEEGNLGLEKIGLQHLALNNKNKGKIIVKAFLKTVLPVLLDDPTASLAGAVVEPLFNAWLG